MHMHQLLLIAWVFCWSMTANAYSILLEGNQPVKWGDTFPTIELNVNGSADVADGADLAEIRAGMQDWNSISCSTLLLQDGGLIVESSTVLVSNQVDNHNRITWIEDDSWSFGQYVVALTMPVWDQTNGFIVEVDTVVNGFHFYWSTDATVGTEDVKSMITHELGHFIGLQHVLGG